MAAKKGHTFAGAPPGSGKNFAALKSSLASRGARNPGALAAYIGRKKYGRKGFAKLSHSHSNQGQAIELAQRIPVSTLDELVMSRIEGGAVIRHRAGGSKIGEIRRSSSGNGWVSVTEDGRELPEHARERGALAELVRNWNTGTATLQRAAREPMPLQQPPASTQLSEQLGIPVVRLATPSNGSSDGPRMTSSDADSGDDLSGLSPKGVSIYRKLCGKMGKDRAKRFAMRAQSFGGK